MNKKFSKSLIIFTIAVVLLPILINVLIYVINTIILKGNNELLSFQSYASYFGGAIGGLATLITIYFVVLKTKDEHRPLIFFNNKHVYYYRNRNGIYHYFSYKYCNEDNLVREMAEPFNFEMTNIGHPAVDFRLSIINLHEFMEVVALLNVDPDFYNKINNSFSKEKDEYYSMSLVKPNDNIVVDQYLFESILLKLLNCYYHNIFNKNFQNNDPFVQGWFKLFSLEATYNDIDGKNYTDIFSVYVHANSSHQPVSRLKQFDIWELNIDFKKGKPTITE